MHTIPKQTGTPALSSELTNPHVSSASMLAEGVRAERMDGIRDVFDVAELLRGCSSANQHRVY